MLLHFIYCKTRVFEPGINLAINNISYCVFCTPASSSLQASTPTFLRTSSLPQYAIHTDIFFLLPKMPSFLFEIFPHFTLHWRHTFFQKMTIESALLRIPSDILAAKPNHFNLNPCRQGIKFKTQAVMAHQGQMSSLSLDSSAVSFLYWVESPGWEIQEIQEQSLISK